MGIPFNFICVLKWLDFKEKREFAAGDCSEICDVERDGFICNKVLGLALWRQLFLSSREKRGIVTSKSNNRKKKKKHKTYVVKDSEDSSPAINFSLLELSVRKIKF